jgi:tetratricopeptide (TPR) repeat protein
MAPRVALSVLVAAVVAAPTLLRAQSASDYITQGNAAYEARSAADALSDYEKALALEPQNYQALWRAARSGVDLGEFDPDKQHRTSVFKTAQERATLAVKVNPDDAEGHFALARALGRMALSLGVRDRVRYAVDVREQALDCLKIDPGHAGCLHVMGVWNAEVMRLNGFQRLFARKFLGGKVLGDASWASARKYMEAAVNAEPRRIVHRLDLARVYADMGMDANARTQFEAVIRGEVLEYNDPRYMAQAAEELAKLGDKGDDLLGSTAPWGGPRAPVPALHELTELFAQSIPWAGMPGTVPA